MDRIINVHNYTIWKLLKRICIGENIFIFIIKRITNGRCIAKTIDGLGY